MFEFEIKFGFCFMIRYCIGWCFIVVLNIIGVIELMIDCLKLIWMC